MNYSQLIIFILVIQVIHFLGTWKLYKKAGRKWWEAAIPIYNGIVLMKIINRPKWWVLLLFIPIINLLMFPIVWIETIRSFGKNSRVDTFLVLISLGFYIYYINYFTDVKYIENRSLKPRSELGEWVSSIAFAIIAATLVHTYFMRPYVIPTSSLEKTLLVGDFLLVSKYHYGARVPMTPLALPMVHDSIPLIHKGSYLKKPQLPYMRLPGLQKIKRNEIVVFNWPADTLATMWGDHSGKYTYKPIDKKTNYVKRCVAIAGDTLQIINGEIYINSKPSILPDRAEPQHLYIYTSKEPFSNRNFPEFLKNNERKSVLKIKKEYWDDARVQKAFEVKADLTKIGQDSLYVDAFGGIAQDLAERLGVTGYNNKLLINLTQKEYERLLKVSSVASLKKVIFPPKKNVFPHNPKYSWSIDNFGPLYIPEEGKTIKINAETIPLYKNLISEYEHLNDVTFTDDELFIDGKKVTDYTFSQNYYWMMGDNRHNSLDARSYGFTPMDHVVGKPVFIWMSWANGMPWSGGTPRWERFFTTVHGQGKPVSYLYYFLGFLGLWFVYSKFIKKKKKKSE